MTHPPRGTWSSDRAARAAVSPTHVESCAEVGCGFGGGSHSKYPVRPDRCGHPAQHLGLARPRRPEHQHTVGGRVEDGVHRGGLVAAEPGSVHFGGGGCGRLGVGSQPGHGSHLS